jgi:hypothetical protein
MDKNDAKIEELKAKMASLDLFNYDSAKREAGISKLPDEIQGPVRSFTKRSVDVFRLIDVLMEDMRKATDEFKKDRDSQYHRRTAIRSLSALVEGLIYSLNQLSHSTADAYGVLVTPEDEIFFRKGKRADGKGKEWFLPFVDNLKHTVNLYAKYSNATSTVSFSDDGFDALRETFAVRDRITHPKTHENMSISTDEARRSGDAIQWVHDLISKLIGGHNAKLESNIKQQVQGPTS